MVRRVARLKVGTRFHFTGFLSGAEVDRMFDEAINRYPDIIGIVVFGVLAVRQYMAWRGVRANALSAVAAK